MIALVWTESPSPEAVDSTLLDDTNVISKTPVCHPYGSKKSVKPRPYLLVMGVVMGAALDQMDQFFSFEQVLMRAIYF